MANIIALICIVLTTDPDLKAKLKRKLAEYKTRMQYRAPETDPHGWYKLNVLARLLTEGMVNVPALQAEFRHHSWYDEYAFADAVSVINAYNSGNNSAVYGGTGLK
jgi:hypothetical protein